MSEIIQEACIIITIIIRYAYFSIRSVRSLGNKHMLSQPHDSLNTDYQRRVIVRRSWTCEWCYTEKHISHMDLVRYL